jgi:hypothetical protein
MKRPDAAGHPRPLRYCLPILFFLLAAFPVAPARAGEAPTFPPGSGVGLVPPAGFTVSPDFTGFADREAVASIVVSEMPKAAYDELVAGFTKDRLAAQGMELLGPCEAVRTLFVSNCYRVSQEANGYLFQKWLLVARLGKITALVVATLPDVVLAEGVYDAEGIEAALSSVAYSQDQAGDPRDALPFTIEEGSLLAYQRTLGGSAALFSGEATAGDPPPVLIVAASLGPSAQARDVEFGRQAFHTIGTLVETRVVEESPLAVGALAGHLFEGTGKDEQSGQALFVLQAVLVDGQDKYYRLVGLAPAAQRELYRPEFLRLMQTLAPR